MGKKDLKKELDEYFRQRGNGNANGDAPAPDPNQNDNRSRNQEAGRERSSGGQERERLTRPPAGLGQSLEAIIKNKTSNAKNANKGGEKDAKRGGDKPAPPGGRRGARPSPREDDEDDYEERRPKRDSRSERNRGGGRNGSRGSRGDMGRDRLPRDPGPFPEPPPELFGLFPPGFLGHPLDLHNPDLPFPVPPSDLFNMFPPGHYHHSALNPPLADADIGGLGILSGSIFPPLPLTGGRMGGGGRGSNRGRGPGRGRGRGPGRGPRAAGTVDDFTFQEGSKWEDIDPNDMVNPRAEGEREREAHRPRSRDPSALDPSAPRGDSDGGLARRANVRGKAVVAPTDALDPPLLGSPLDEGLGRPSDAPRRVLSKGLGEEKSPVHREERKRLRSPPPASNPRAEFDNPRPPASDRSGPWDNRPPLRGSRDRSRSPPPRERPGSLPTRPPYPGGVGRGIDRLRDEWEGPDERRRVSRRDDSRNMDDPYPSYPPYGHPPADHRRDRGSHRPLSRAPDPSTDGYLVPRGSSRYPPDDPPRYPRRIYDPYSYDGYEAPHGSRSRPLPSNPPPSGPLRYGRDDMMDRGRGAGLYPDYPEEEDRDPIPPHRPSRHPSSVAPPAYPLDPLPRPERYEGRGRGGHEGQGWGGQAAAAQRHRTDVDDRDRDEEAGRPIKKAAQEGDVRRGPPAIHPAPEPEPEPEPAAEAEPDIKITKDFLDELLSSGDLTRDEYDIILSGSCTIALRDTLLRLMRKQGRDQ